MEAAWTIQKIMNNKNNLVNIDINSHQTGGRPVNIRGWSYQDTYSFTTGAEWTDIEATAKQAISSAFDWLPEALNRRIKGAADIIANTANLGAAMIGMGKSVAGSILKWDGSTSAMPPVHLLFVALKPDDRPQENAVKLLSSCLPGIPRNGTQTNRDWFFWAPNGYDPTGVINDAKERGLGYGGANIEGTCTLKIGQWFEVSGLVPTEAQFEMSKETTKKGNPLFVSGSVTFRPYRDLKGSEYEELFKRI